MTKFILASLLASVAAEDIGCQAVKYLYQQESCCNDPNKMFNVEHCIGADKSAQLQRALDASGFRDIYSGVGLSVVAQDGSRAFAGFGNRTLAGHPVKEDTIFRIQSMSKFLVGITMMKMVELGFMDDPSRMDTTTLFPKLANAKVIVPLHKDEDCEMCHDFKRISDGQHWSGEVFNLTITNGHLYEIGRNDAAIGNKTYYYGLEPIARAPTFLELLNHRSGIGYEYTGVRTNVWTSKAPHLAESNAIFVNLYRSAGVFADQREKVIPFVDIQNAIRARGSEALYADTGVMDAEAASLKTSGTYRNWFDMTIGEYVERLLELPFVHQPGEFQQYTEEMNLVAGAMDNLIQTRKLTSPSGRQLVDFEDLMVEYITKPLGIQDEIFWFYKDDDARIARRARLNSPVSEYTSSFSRSYDVVGYRKCKSGSGGASASSKGFAILMAAITNGGEIDGKRAFSPITARRIFHTADPSTTLTPSPYEGVAFPGLANEAYSYTGADQKAAYGFSYPDKFVVAHGGAYRTFGMASSIARSGLAIGTVGGSPRPAMGLTHSLYRASISLNSCTEHTPMDSDQVSTENAHTLHANNKVLTGRRMSEEDPTAEQVDE